VQRIAQEAAARNVEAVLVAGDVFENNLVGNETVHGVLHAMEGFKGDWVLIPGNHDPGVAESVWQRIQSLGTPKNLHLALEPEPILVADSRLVILPAPLRRKHEFEDLTAVWDSIDTPASAARVGLAHGSVEGRLPQESEATNLINVNRENLARLDYLALGDWHGTQKVATRTWYSGTPEPDRFKDNDAGNVLLVTIAAPGSQLVVEPLHVARFTWTSIAAHLNGNEDLGALEAQFSSLGEPFDQYIVSLVVAGTVDFATRELFDRLLSRWRGRFTSLGDDCLQLVAQPTDADLDRIDSGGFVRTAMENLRAVHANPSDPNHKYATGALRLLYQIHTVGAQTK
jgi:hypothetical protein